MQACKGERSISILGFEGTRDAVVNLGFSNVRVV